MQGSDLITQICQKDLLIHNYSLIPQGQRQNFIEMLMAQKQEEHYYLYQQIKQYSDLNLLSTPLKKAFKEVSSEGLLFSLKHLNFLLWDIFNKSVTFKISKVAQFTRELIQTFIDGQLEVILIKSFTHQLLPNERNPDQLHILQQEEIEVLADTASLAIRISLLSARGDKKKKLSIGGNKLLQSEQQNNVVEGCSAVVNEVGVLSIQGQQEFLASMQQINYLLKTIHLADKQNELERHVQIIYVYSVFALKCLDAEHIQNNFQMMLDLFDNFWVLFLSEDRKILCLNECQQDKNISFLEEWRTVLLTQKNLLKAECQEKQNYCKQVRAHHQSPFPGALNDNFFDFIKASCQKFFFQKKVLHKLSITSKMKNNIPIVVDIAILFMEILEEQLMKILVTSSQEEQKQDQKQLSEKEEQQQQIDKIKEQAYQQSLLPNYIKQIIVSSLETVNELKLIFNLIYQNFDKENFQNIIVLQLLENLKMLAAKQLQKQPSIDQTIKSFLISLNQFIGNDPRCVTKNILERFTLEEIQGIKQTIIINMNNQILNNQEALSYIYFLISVYTLPVVSAKKEERKHIIELIQKIMLNNSTTSISKTNSMNNQQPSTLLLCAQPLFSLYRMSCSIECLEIHLIFLNFIQDNYYIEDSQDLIIQLFIQMDQYFWNGGDGTNSLKTQQSSSVIFQNSSEILMSNEVSPGSVIQQQSSLKGDSKEELMRSQFRAFHCHFLLMMSIHRQMKFDEDDMQTMFYKMQLLSEENQEIYRMMPNDTKIIKNGLYHQELQMLLDTEDPWLLIQFLKLHLVYFRYMNQSEMEDLIDPLQDLFMVTLKILQSVNLYTLREHPLVHNAPSYIVFIINLLFNLATKAEYHWQVEQELFNNDFYNMYSLQVVRATDQSIQIVPNSQLLNSLLSEFEKKYQSGTQFLQFRIQFFFELILSVFIEVELPQYVKSFYYQLIYSCVVNSMSNAILLGKEKIMRKLVLLLRIEKEKSLNKLLFELVLESFQTNLGVSQLSAFTFVLQPKLALDTICVLQHGPQSQLATILQQTDQYQRLLNQFIYLMKSLTNAQTFRRKKAMYYFSGLESAIVANAAVPFLAGQKEKNLQFSIILHFNMEFAKDIQQISKVMNTRSTTLLNQSFDDSGENKYFLLSLVNEFQGTIEIIIKQQDRNLILITLALNQTSMTQNYSDHFYQEINFKIQENQRNEWLFLIINYKDDQFTLNLDGKPCTLYEGNEIHPKLNREQYLEQQREQRLQFMQKMQELRCITIGASLDQNEGGAYGQGQSNLQNSKISNNNQSAINKFKQSLSNSSQNNSSIIEAQSNIYQAGLACKLKQLCFAGSLDVFYLMNSAQENRLVYEELWLKNKTNKQKFHKLVCEQFQNYIVASLSFSSTCLSSMSKINLMEMDLCNWQTFDEMKDSPLNVMPSPGHAHRSSHSKGFWGNLFSTFGNGTNNALKKTDSNSQHGGSSISKNGVISDGVQILVKGVTFLEKNTFKDVILSIGNMEIFIYIIDLLTMHNLECGYNTIEEERKNTCELVTNVLDLIQQLMLEDKNDELREFFTEQDNNGMMILGFLLSRFFMKFRYCTMELRQKIFDFVNKSFSPDQRRLSNADSEICSNQLSQILTTSTITPSSNTNTSNKTAKFQPNIEMFISNYLNELRLSAYQNIMMNFEIWTHTDEEVQLAVISQIEKLIIEDLKYQQQFKEEFKIDYILYIVLNYFNDEKILTNLDVGRRKILLECRLKLLDIVKFICMSSFSNLSEQVQQHQQHSNEGCQQQQQQQPKNQIKLIKRQSNELESKKMQNMQNYQRQEVGILLNFITQCEIGEMLKDLLKTLESLMDDYTFQLKLYNLIIQYSGIYSQASSSSQSSSNSGSPQNFSINLNMSQKLGHSNNNSRTNSEQGGVSGSTINQSLGANTGAGTGTNTGTGTGIGPGSGVGIGTNIVSGANLNYDDFYKDNLPLPTTIKEIMKGLLCRISSKDMDRDLPLIERLQMNLEDSLISAVITILLDYDLLMLKVNQKKNTNNPNICNISKAGLKDSLNTIVTQLPNKLGPSTLNALSNFMEKSHHLGLYLEIKVIESLLKRLKQQDSDIQAKILQKIYDNINIYTCQRKEHREQFDQFMNKLINITEFQNICSPELLSTPSNAIDNQQQQSLTTSTISTNSTIVNTSNNKSSKFYHENIQLNVMQYFMEKQGHAVNQIILHFNISDMQHFQLFLQIIFAIQSQFIQSSYGTLIHQGDSIPSSSSSINFTEKEVLTVAHNLIQCLFLIETIIWKNKELKSDKHTTDFLVQILMKYQNIFSDIHILLSTWPHIDILEHTYNFSLPDAKMTPWENLKQKNFRSIIPNGGIARAMLSILFCLLENEQFNVFQLIENMFENFRLSSLEVIESHNQQLKKIIKYFDNVDVEKSECGLFLKQQPEKRSSLMAKSAQLSSELQKQPQQQQQQQSQSQQQIVVQSSPPSSSLQKDNFQETIGDQIFYSFLKFLVEKIYKEMQNEGKVRKKSYQEGEDENGNMISQPNWDIQLKCCIILKKAFNQASLSKILARNPIVQDFSTKQPRKLSSMPEQQQQQQYISPSESQYMQQINFYNKLMMVQELPQTPHLIFLNEKISPLFHKPNITDKEFTFSFIQFIHKHVDHLHRDFLNIIKSQLMFYVKMPSICYSLLQDYCLENKMYLQQKSSFTKFQSGTDMTQYLQDYQPSLQQSMVSTQSTAVKQATDPKMIVYYDIRDKFNKVLKSFDENEKIKQMKIFKQWKFIKKKLTNSSGFWFYEDPDVINSEIFLYKVDKLEDKLRRRFNLKRDKKWQEKSYIDHIGSPKGPQQSGGGRNRLSSVSSRSQSGAKMSQNRGRQASSGNNMMMSASTNLNGSQIIKLNNSQQLEELKNNEGISKQEANQFEGLTPMMLHLNQISASVNKQYEHAAEYVTQKGAIFGTVRVMRDHFIFDASPHPRPNEKQYWLGANKEQLINGAKKKKQWKIFEIKKVFTRRFNLRNSAFEIFTDDDKAYFFNVYDVKEVELLLNSMQFFNQKIIIIRNRKKAFEDGRFTEAWKDGRISNFEYLMILNTYSGRSFNDINQYPVFPWVIQDYESNTIDFQTSTNTNTKGITITNPTALNNDNSSKAVQSQKYQQNKDNLPFSTSVQSMNQLNSNHKIYRNLALPIGAQNNEHYKFFEDRFKEAKKQDIDIYFIYGTHYSHPTIVMTFLIRMEPFTTLHFKQQSNRFDHADRLFHSIQEQWHSGQQNTSKLKCFFHYYIDYNLGDVKELIPEFYYMPDFLVNKNLLKLGKKYSGDQVNNVILPQWVKSGTPEEFIFKMRQALESNYVSLRLHDWIDLIFGYKQSGEEAIKAKNLFHYFTYEENVDFSKMDDDDIISRNAQISFYGQTPFRLFDKKHDPRSLIEKSKFYYLLSPFVPEVLTVFGRMKEEVIEVVFQVEGKGIYALTNQYKLHFFSFETRFQQQDSGKKGIKKKKSYDIEKFLVQYNFKNQVAMYNNLLFIVGYVDHSFKVFDTIKNTYSSMYFHKKIVTCIDFALIEPNKPIIAVGSRDCRASIWKLLESQCIQQQPEFVLYGHHYEIVAIKINETLKIIVSADLDGKIIIHSASKGRCLASVKLPLYCEMVDLVRIHECGLIAFLSNKQNFFLYNYNGEQYLKVKIQLAGNKKNGPSEQQITDFCFYSDLHSQVYFSTNEGKIYGFDIFELKVNEKNKAIDLSIQHQELLEKFGVQNIKGESNSDFKQVATVRINSFCFFKDQGIMQILVCGYENGCMAFVKESVEKLYRHITEDMMELGFLDPNQKKQQMQLQQ